MIANFGPGHWAVLAVVVILLFGAKKLPDAAQQVGKSLRIFRSEIRELKVETGTEEQSRAAESAAPH